MIPGDNVRPEERLRQRSGYPVVLAMIAIMLLAYGLAQFVTDWGARAPLVTHAVVRSCGL